MNIEKERHKINMFEQKDLQNNQRFNVIKDTNANLYPEWDFSIYWRSCEEEIVDPICGKVIGEIPKWLKGSLLRNGPGISNITDTQDEHLFDRVALIHK